MVISVQLQIEWVEKKLAALEKDKRQAKEHDMVFSIRKINDEIKIMQSILKVLYDARDKSVVQDKNIIAV